MKPDPGSPHSSIELDERTTALQRLHESTQAESLEFQISRSAAESNAPHANLDPGDKVGKYVIRNRLGAGGMGTVYTAFDPLIEREVALKILTSPSSGATDSELRFLQEARAIGRLNHPNVVSIYDIDQWNGHYFIVMELLAGGSLARRMRQQGAMPWPQACNICLQAAEGLAAAHEANLVHRDIKPDNLMLSADQTVKVVDFGLSKLESDSLDSQAPITKVGYILGTPQYMSPEQFDASSVDARTDIYSLGVTLFHLLTGEFPFQQAKTVVQMMNAHLTKPVPLVSERNPQIPSLVDDVLQRAMAKSPAMRFQTAHDFATALRQLIEGSSKSTLELSPLFEACTDQPLKKVLIVEPSKMQAAMQVTAWKRMQVTAHVAASAQLARELFARERPDVLVTAMALDDGSGIELIASLNSAGLLKNVCTTLNSQDSSIDDLIAATGGSTNAILTGKKESIEDLLRLVHGSSSHYCQSSAWLAPVLPSTHKMVLFTENGGVPAALSELIRASGVLDISVFPAAGEASGYQASPHELRLVWRDSQTSTEAQFYCKLLEPFAVDEVVTAAIQIDAAGLSLRAVSYKGLLATTNCPLNQSRLRRLLEACSAH